MSLGLNTRTVCRHYVSMSLNFSGGQYLLYKSHLSFTAIFTKNLIFVRTCCGRSIRDLAASCDSVASVMVTNCAEGYCCSNSVQTSLTCNTKPMRVKITPAWVYYWGIYIRQDFRLCECERFGMLLLLMHPELGPGVNGR